MMPFKKDINSNRITGTFMIINIDQVKFTVSLEDRGLVILLHSKALIGLLSTKGDFVDFCPFFTLEKALEIE